MRIKVKECDWCIVLSVVFLLVLNDLLVIMYLKIVIFNQNVNNIFVMFLVVQEIDFTT